MEVTIFSCTVIVAWMFISLQKDHWSFCSLWYRPGVICFLLLYFFTKPPCKGGFIFLTSPVEMWVSVLLLGAAEHLVIRCRGHCTPSCLSVPARPSSLIKWSQWHSLPPIMREGDNMRTRCIRTWSAWRMKCLNYVFVSVGFWVKSLPSLSGLRGLRSFRCMPTRALN